jgi:Aspartate/tyrosine/aromatic aminotransferase
MQENKIIELRKRYQENFTECLDRNKELIEKIEQNYVKQKEIGNKVQESLEMSDYTSFKEPSFYKKYFNKFFNEDTYNKYWNEDNILLSTGSLDECQFPLFESLKYTLEYALGKNWYGYSSSVGRDSARNSIALLENAVIKREHYYTADNVCVTMGVTAALSSIMMFIKRKKKKKIVTLTHLPNYAPFITTCEEFGDLSYFSLNERGIDIEAIISKLSDEVDVLLLTGDLNPLGVTISQEDLERISCICKERKIYFIYDRAGRKNGLIDYEAFLVHDYAVIMESMSKKISVPGMKIGYFLSGKEFINDFYEYASTNYGGPASIFYLLLEFDSVFTKYYLQGKKEICESDLVSYEYTYKLNKEWLQSMYDDYVKSYEFNHKVVGLQRDLVCRMLLNAPRVKKVIPADVGVNLFVLLDYDKSSYEFYEELIQSRGVAVFPGICCGLDKGCWIRITISVEYQRLMDGIHLILDYISQN